MPQVHASNLELETMTLAFVYSAPFLMHQDLALAQIGPFILRVKNFRRRTLRIR